MGAPEKSGGPIIRLDNVTKDYGDFRVVEGISLDIEDGDFFIFVGPTGCGRTVLLRLIAGFEQPSGGTIYYKGEPVVGPSPERGMIYQDVLLFPWMKVLDNVVYGLKTRGYPREEYERDGREWLRRIGLGRFENNYVYELSGGMQQRVGIARIMVNRSRVILCDEPFGSLDWIAREALQTELLKVWEGTDGSQAASASGTTEREVLQGDLRRIWEETRRTIIHTTHSMEEAVFLGQKVAILSPRPATITEVVEIDLPERRWEGEVRFSKRYAELVEYISSKIP
ncbi:MAG: ABC transporter ATP-binding protein [Nitrospinota bacterium]